MWILRRVDKILVLGTDGAMFGERDQILAKVAGPQPGQAAVAARETVHA